MDVTVDSHEENVSEGRGGPAAKGSDSWTPLNSRGGNSASTGPTLTSVLSCRTSDAVASARAAVAFGKAALEVALRLTMPNGEQCQIRAGVHTGDVCSGVVGSRMPR